MTKENFLKRNYYLIFITFIKALIESTVPLCFMQIINQIVKKDFNSFLLWVCITIITYSVLLIYAVFYEYSKEKIIEKKLLEFKKMLLQKYVINDSKNDEYLTVIYTDVNILKGYFLSIYGLYLSSFTLIVTFLILFRINFYLLIIFIISVYISYYISVTFNKKLNNIGKEKSIKINTSVNSIISFLMKFIVFNFFNNEKNYYDIINLKYDDLINKKKELEKMKTIYSFIFEITNIFSFTLVLSATFILVIYNQITIGVLFAIKSILSNTTRSLVSINTMLENIGVGKGVLSKYEDVFENVVEEKTYLENDIENITLHNICLLYDDKEIFKDVSYNFEKSRKYLIIGDSGSGKSTLVKMLIGLINPSSGNVYINGVDIEDISKEYIFDNISFIDSNNYILEANIYDNISLYNKDELRVEEIIKLLELDNIDKEMYLNEENISQGQKQRINIARALYFNRDVVIIDEAFVNLDKNLREKLENIFLESSKTVIMITHQYNEEYLNKFDKIINV